MTTKINAQQLAYLLNITNYAAKIKILRCTGKEKEHEFFDDPVIDIDVFEEKSSIKIKDAIIDIYENALKRPGFRKHIMYDFPLSKLDTKNPPKTVRLVPALRSLMNPDDLNELKSYWVKTFGNFRSEKWGKELEEYKPILNP